MRAHHATNATGLYDIESDFLPALWLAPEPGWNLPAHDVLGLSRIFPGHACFLWVVARGFDGSERLRQKRRIFDHRWPALRGAVVHNSEITVGHEEQFCDVAKVDTAEAADELAKFTLSNTFGESRGLIMFKAAVPPPPGSLIRLIELKAGRSDEDSAERHEEHHRLRRSYLAESRAQGDIPLLVFDDCDMRQFYVAPVAVGEFDPSELEQVPEDEFRRWLKLLMRIRL
jgi:hypothetical protein